VPHHHPPFGGPIEGVSAQRFLSQLGWAVVRTVAGAVVGVTLAPVVAPALLGVVGFGPAGPIAGTFSTISSLNYGAFLIPWEQLL